MSIFSFSAEGARPPTVAIEVAPHQVSGAALDLRGSQPRIAAHVVEPLPEAALVPSLTEHNVRDQGAVAAAVDRVVERLGRPQRVGLLIPDFAVKVSVVRFEQVPTRQHDLDEIIRWQVGKTAPFDLDGAQVGYVAGGRGPEGQEFVVTLARRDIVREYEELCAEAGALAGVVDIAAFNVINAVVAGSGTLEADWLLVNVSSGGAAIAVLRGPDPIFFRNRTADSDGTLADSVHQTAMYYEDRLQGTGFGRVLLSGASTATGDAGDAEPVRRAIQARLGVRVETVDVRTAVVLAEEILIAPVVLDALAPLVGLLLRGHAAGSA